MVEGFKEFCKLSKAQFKLMAAQERRDLLKFILERVDYSPNKNEINITGCVPTEIRKNTLSGYPSNLLNGWNIAHMLRFNLRVKV